MSADATAYVALLEGGKREEPVTVTRLAPGVYEVELRGKLHRVEAFRQDPATMTVLLGTESHAVELDQAPKGLSVYVSDEVHALEILDERRLRMRRAAGGFASDGRQAIAAPMAGRVVKVLVKAGEAVRAGQGLVVLEAMKMENEMKSPIDGKVLSLHVVEGQPVEGGAPIAVVE